MARRSDHSRDELTAMVLNAARDIVAQEGLRGLTVRAVTRRIGYAVGTLYNLFENLDAVILALNGQTLDALHHRLAAAPRRGDPHADLLALADAYIGFTQEHANLWQVLFEHHLPPGQDLPDWYHAKLTDLLAFVEEAMAPLFPPEKAEERRETARILWCGLHGICSLAGDGKLDIVTERPTRTLAHALITTVVEGLKSKQPGGNPA